jgi:hypothetical protein
MRAHDAAFRRELTTISGTPMTTQSASAPQGESFYINFTIVLASFR